MSVVDAYRRLLSLLPAHVRDAHGPEMLRLFRDQLRLLRREGRSTAGFVMRAFLDLTFGALAERTAPLGRWSFWMTAFLADLRYGARLLWKNPGMTFIAVLTLALGIGANAAIFSLLDAVLLRPLPYAEPDNLVMLWEKRPAESVFENPVSPADYRDWAARQQSLSHIAAIVRTSSDLTGGAEPERVPAAAVSASFFDLFRVQPMHGRTFRSYEEELGRHRVVVLDDGLWRRRFGADPAIVGQTISLSGVAYDVIGVLPESFEFPGEPIDIWRPLSLPGEQPRGAHFLEVFGRLKPGISVERARAQMDQVGAQLSAEYPETNQRHGVHVVSLREQLHGPVRAGLWILGGAVGFILLIACVNVSNMLLARAAARRREMAVRAAIGAGRARLAGQAITESLLLSALGAAAGLALAAVAIEALPALIAAQEPLFGLEAASLDWRTVLFACAAAVLAGLLFGALPAWHAANDDPNRALKSGGRSISGLPRKLRLGLVGIEVALASLLLVGAGVALRSFSQMLAQPTGLQTAGVLTFELVLPVARYRESAQVRTTMQAIEDRLRAMPGVQSVSSATHLPLSGSDGRNGIVIEGREYREGDAPTRAHPRPVGTDYFRTVGTTLAQGRAFTEADDDRAQPVTIINETAAARYWPGVHPIGKRVMLTGTDQWLTIVGVLKDVRHWGLDRPVNPELYVPSRQGVERFTSFVLKTDGDPLRLAQPAREAVRAVDKDLPISRVRTLDAVAAKSAAARRSTMVLLGAFALVALVLAAAGVYGVMAHFVAMRMSEIAIRMTLGASPRNVLGGIMREGALVSAAGLLVGFTASLALVEVLRTVTFGIQPLDPVTYLSVAVVLTGATLLACWVPARRAMRVDPAGVMR